MNPTSTEILASALFGIAILHTFSVRRIAEIAHHCEENSISRALLHFLAETEIVFGVWAAILFAGIALLTGSLAESVKYVESLNFAEPKFVLVVMVVAATRPVILFAGKLLVAVASRLPLSPAAGFYLTALTLGPLLGSLITEPAAMTLLALLLKRQFFDRGISTKFAYATLGLLFVNVSIGGTLTHFAAPPVLMVAGKWGWGIGHMLSNFGWKAAASCATSSICCVLAFRKELDAITLEQEANDSPPLWLTTLHLASLGLVVYFAHHPDVLFGVFVLFLGLVAATQRHQEPLKLKEGLLVGFFLSGLVMLGSLQAYWLKPLITSLGGNALFFGATGLTAFTDNAAITYLGSMVEGISDQLKYAIVAGAVTGGGLTVIANAPNPAGVGILQSSRAFQGRGISPVGLLLGALPPTLIAILFFWLAGHP